MEPILLLFMLPGMLIFDFIPSLFGFQGLTDWYLDNNPGKTADAIASWYMMFTVVVLIILFIIFKDTL